jgi:hypothetical protein
MNLSNVIVRGPNEYEHTTRFMIDQVPALDRTHRLRMANMAKKGWTDGREMKLNASIDAEVLWVAENIGCPCDYCRGRIWNLYDKGEYRKYLVVHPEWLVAPIDTGRSGKIIIKGE